MTEFQNGDIVTPSNCPIQHMTVNAYIDGRVICSTTSGTEVFYPENLILVQKDDLSEEIKDQVAKCGSLFSEMGEFKEIKGFKFLPYNQEKAVEKKQETWRDRESLL